MPQLRAPGAAQEQARRLLLGVFDSTRPGRILLVIALLVSLGWFTDSLFELLLDLDSWRNGAAIENWWPLHRVLGAGTFVAIVLGLWLYAALARKRYRPRVASDYQPAAVRGLILYLSALSPPPSKNDITALSDMEGFKNALGGGPWRMPIEAIKHHLPRLQRVIVISSSGKGGSHAQSDQFKQLCGQLFGTELRVDDISALDNSWTGGIDFNDVERLTHATDDAHRLLEQAGQGQQDILIDVTGGQKTNSIAGAAVALAEGRTIQYVARDREQDTYQIIAYDVTYDQ